MLRGPLDARRLIERVESHPVFDSVEATSFSIGHLCVDTRAHLVKINDAPVSLTPTEFQILIHFIKNPIRNVKGKGYVLDI
jgi:DNA-binding response OmpR family regulator